MLRGSGGVICVLMACAALCSMCRERAGVGPSEDGGVDASSISGDAAQPADASTDSGTPEQVQRVALLAVDTERLGVLIGYGQPMTMGEADPYVRSPEAGGDVVFGVDLGITVQHEVDGEGRTYFFFGDTWPLKQDYEQTGVAEWIGLSQQRAESGVNNGDCIGYTTDTDPTDGVHLDHVLRNSEGGAAACSLVGDNAFRATYVPGVNLRCTGNHVLPQDHSDYVFFTVEVPTGAASIPEFGSNGSALVLWYSRLPPSLSDAYLAESYVAVSLDDGLTWQTLQNEGGVPRAFSGPTTAGTHVEPGRFINISPVLVDAAEYQSPASLPCNLPLPPGEDTRGLLLFASGHYRASDVYLAFLPVSSLEEAFDDPSRAIEGLMYFSGESSGCWSPLEQDAKPVIRATDAAIFARYESLCGYRVIEAITGAGVGELSVKRIRTDLASGPFDRLVAMFALLHFPCVSTEDSCCGATAVPGQDLCRGRFSDQYSGDVRVGSMGIAVMAADPLRPWRWETSVPEAHPSIDTVGLEFAPAFVPAAPGDPIGGLGMVCEYAHHPGGGGLYGYGPYILGGMERASRDGVGVDIFFVLSRWKGEVTNLEDGPYRVELFRTTLVPLER